MTGIKNYVYYFTHPGTDLNNPVILGCPTAGATGVLPPGSSTVPVSWTEPTQMDNSGMSTFMTTHIPGSPFREGTTEVLYTAEDIADNSAECSFIVTVTSSGKSQVIFGVFQIKQVEY